MLNQCQCCYMEFKIESKEIERGGADFDGDDDEEVYGEGKSEIVDDIYAWPMPSYTSSGDSKRSK